MTFLIAFVFLFFFWYFTPKWFWGSLIAAILGLAAGGFFWALAAMVFPQLITLKAFLVFIVTATATSGIVIFRPR